MHSCKNGCKHEKIPEDKDLVSLLQYIDIEKVSCLNELNESSCKTVFKPWSERLESGSLKSDPDFAELLLFVPFTSIVSIRNLSIISKNGDSAPKNVKIWANKSNVSDFPSVEDVEEDFKADLIDDFKGEVCYTLSPEKFSQVEFLAVYLYDENREEGEIEAIHIEFRGDYKMGKSRAVETVYELTAVGKSSLLKDSSDYSMRFQQ